MVGMLMTHCLFPFGKDADEFFRLLNFCHPNIKFTFEKEEDSSTIFLEKCINISIRAFGAVCFGKVSRLGYIQTLGTFCSFRIRLDLSRPS